MELATCPGNNEHGSAEARTLRTPERRREIMCASIQAYNQSTTRRHVDRNTYGTVSYPMSDVPMRDGASPRRLPPPCPPHSLDTVALSVDCSSLTSITVPFSFASWWTCAKASGEIPACASRRRIISFSSCSRHCSFFIFHSVLTGHEGHDRGVVSRASRRHGKGVHRSGVAQQGSLEAA